MKKNLITVVLMIVIQGISFAQNIIQGNIYDENNIPIPGANIIVPNTNIGVTGNENGYFKIESKDEIKAIVISCLGFKTDTITDISGKLKIKLQTAIANINEITIAEKYTKPVKRTSDAIYTGSAITKAGINLMGASASNSVYNALDFMPGVNVESNDAYGLGEKTVRIRSIKNYFSGMTIEGFPNYGVMPIGARDDIYDMENMQQIAIYKGATPSDLGTATGSKGGAIELKRKRPSKKFATELHQSYGMNNFMRTFLRIDLGTLKTGTGILMSGSFTQADKWKGEGKSGPRENLALGITQKINKNINIELFVNYNKMLKRDYRPLNYQETQSLKDFYKKDYTPTLSGNPDTDRFYYEYNGGEFINKDIQAIFNYKINSENDFSLRYYYSAEDADYLEGVKKGPNNMVFNRTRDIDRTGTIAAFSGSKNNLRYACGYWLELTDNGAFVYQSKITDNGLNPIGYSYFTDKTYKGQVHSPYAKLAYSVGKLNLQTGVKYFYYMDPESNRYTSVSPTELSDEANPNLHTDEMQYAKLLPTAGVGFKANKKLEFYFNYGKNYMRPYMYSPIISLYVKNMQAFNNVGMNLQSIFNDWEMETSDNFDLGFRFNTKKIKLSSSVFYAKHHDVLASAYNPDVALDYFQNVGELTAYGIDVELYWFPFKNLMFFATPTYTVMSYDNNLIRKDNQTSSAIEIAGNMTPATPKYAFKTGGLYFYKGFEIAAKVKYTGIRYGDITNTEKINAYTLADASISYSYTKFKFIKEIKAGIEAKNVLNTKYIGGIDVSDDSESGNAMYYVGVPLTIMGKLIFKF